LTGQTKRGILCSLYGSAVLTTGLATQAEQGEQLLEQESVLDASHFN